MIQYGLLLNILNQTSTTVNGNRDVSVANETHVVVVDSLLPETTYYFRVIARNAFGSTQSEIGTFTTLPKQQGQKRRKVTEIGGAPMIVHVQAHTLRGVWGHAPPKFIFKMRCSEIASEAMFVPKCH